ncbi:MAG: hypothetical protein ACI86H_002522 [bacterium]|jgi:hypothetical protein
MEIVEKIRGMLKEAKEILRKERSLQSIQITNEMTVENLKTLFRESFNTEIRIYKTTNTGKGARVAEDHHKLSDVYKNRKNIKSITIQKYNTVGEIEDEFKDKLGVGIQIMKPDGKTFAPNEIRLKDVK